MRGPGVSCADGDRGDVGQEIRGRVLGGAVADCGVERLLSLSQSGGIALDASGNVWVSTDGSNGLTQLLGPP